nr:immunoglobulin light chain junction region [Macaca mulatta]
DYYCMTWHNNLWVF